ncbi:MAG: sigma-70 family RNA polymerase sigma factor [Verrucomicrobia bacterium]|jgi:RNA polymerase sigma-70 factor (ECF subfamily)|nr:sigma-70 family RNA polymerase sigma factor [Verrucomicrobiota bacterium]
MKISKTIANEFISDAKKAVGDAVVSDRDLDWAIVQRVQNGEVSAFNQLVQKYRQSLFSIIYNMTGNREDATDIAQDVFIKAFQSIKQFRGQSSFYTWLYRIAVNSSITFIKRAKKQRFINYETIDETLVSSEILEYFTAKTKTEKGALLKELQEKLNEALQKLSPKHRIVVILHEVEGMNHKEIADITKTSEGTVRSRLHYAKKMLQAFLQEYVG